MKKFEVGFTYEETGTCVIEARSLAEAEHIMQQKLEMEAEVGFQCDTTNRDIVVHKAREMSIKSATADIPYDSFYMDEEFEGEVEWDMTIFFIDMDEDPTTPYEERGVTVVASSEEEARRTARDIGYSLEEANLSNNLSIEVELA